MSWVLEASDTTPSSAIASANQAGSCRASASAASATPPVICRLTTMRFLLRKSSRKGLHKALKTQARPSMPVQRAICSLGTPMLLNISPATSATL
jgi:hypothetical protein